MLGREEACERGRMEDLWSNAKLCTCTKESAGPEGEDLYVNKDSAACTRPGEFRVTNHQNRKVSLNTWGLLLRGQKCHASKKQGTCSEVKATLDPQQRSLQTGME